MNKENQIIYSGFWRRAAASILDQLFFLLILSLMSLLGYFIAHKLGDTKYPIIAYAAFFMFVFYFPIQQSSKYQATFGMRIMDLKIYTSSMQKVGFFRSFIRCVLFTLSSAFCTPAIISLPMIIFTKKKQALHDMICKTVVTVEKKG